MSSVGVEGFHVQQRSEKGGAGYPGTIFRAWLFRGLSGRFWQFGMASPAVLAHSQTERKRRTFGLRLPNFANWKNLFASTDMFFPIAFCFSNFRSSTTQHGRTKFLFCSRLVGRRRAPHHRRITEGGSGLSPLEPTGCHDPFRGAEVPVPVLPRGPMLPHSTQGPPASSLAWWCAVHCLFLLPFGARSTFFTTSAGRPSFI